MMRGLAAVAVLLATSARAATIEVDTRAIRRPLSRLPGSWSLGTKTPFEPRRRTSAARSSRCSAEGGNLHAGIDIGTQVRMKGYATVVLPKAMCASACGLIWLAGSSRAIMYDKRGNYGRVGFHAVVNSEDGQQSVGNAWVGAFARLGPSDAVITYLTDAPPEDTQMADASR
jgi:hypothetical protein